jgi:hypothetical protein
MKKIFLILLVCIALIGVTSAAIEQIDVPQRDCARLIQSISNVTFCNITEILYPNLSIALETDVEMTKDGSRYNYSFCDTGTLGIHIISGVCGNTTNQNTFDYHLEVTTGFIGSLGFYVIIISIVALLFILGFSIKDPYIIIMGSFGLTFLALMFLFYGIDGWRDPVYTWAITLILLVTAGYIAVRTSMDTLFD